MPGPNRRRPAPLLIALLPAVVLTFAACDDDGSEADVTPNATTGATRIAGTPEPARTPAPGMTQAPATPADGAAEVQGIVGSVDTDEGVIVINRLSGAEVSRVVVQSGTDVRDTQGRELRLSQIRASDRLFARGEVEGEELIADEITIGQVVPGTSPG